MTGFRPQDRELLTVMERALMESSRPAQIKLFTMAQLKAKITRARKLWDKYRTLGRRQHRLNNENSGRARSNPLSNMRTERKGQLFEEALSRFEKRLAQIHKDQLKKTSSRRKPLPTGRDPQAAQRASLRKKKQRRLAAGESALAKKVT
jgi:hypothetical protein